MAGDWYWEGHVQSSLARFLESEGWTILSEADTATKAHGVDLIATQGGRNLAIEVKGVSLRQRSKSSLSGSRRATTSLRQDQSVIAATSGACVGTELDRYRSDPDRPSSLVAVHLSSTPHLPGRQSVTCRRIWQD
jgi:Holliday junction resolvase-like predicted endonuclease